MGPLEAMVFLDASCYFWTRRGISARVHKKRAAGRAGEGRMAKLFLDTSWGGRVGGQAAKVISGHVFSKIISGHVSGRAGGRTKLFLDTFSAKLFLDTSPGGRAGGQAAKVISGHVFSKIISGHVSGRAGGRTSCQSYFWTRLRAGVRAGGQAAKVISGHVFRKIISGHVSGRAGGRGKATKIIAFCVAGERFWKLLA